MAPKLTGKQKAAILLISMGKESSAKVFNYLPEDEIEKLTIAIANMRKVDGTRKRKLC